MESNMYSEILQCCMEGGSTTPKTDFFSIALCDIKYVLSLLSYVAHTPSRLTCLTDLHALRAFTLYVFLSSCFTCLTYVPYLRVLLSLYLRPLCALFVSFKIS